MGWAWKFFQSNSTKFLCIDQLILLEEKKKNFLWHIYYILRGAKAVFPASDANYFNAIFHSCSWYKKFSPFINVHKFFQQLHGITALLAKKCLKLLYIPRIYNTGWMQQARGLINHFLLNSKTPEELCPEKFRAWSARVPLWLKNLQYFLASNYRNLPGRFVFLLALLRGYAGFSP